MANSDNDDSSRANQINSRGAVFENVNGSNYAIRNANIYVSQPFDNNSNNNNNNNNNGKDNDNLKSQGSV